MNEYDSVGQLALSPRPIATDDEVIWKEALTLSEFTQQQLDGIARTVPGGANNVQDIYPLSPLQEGMLFHNLLSEHGDTYVLSALFELGAAVSTDSFIDSVQATIDRHDILRSAMVWQELPKAVQVVYRKANVSVETLVFDGNRKTVEQLKARLTPQHRRWDLQKAPLVLIEVEPNAHDTHWHAFLRVHHIICDHQSLKMMIAEILNNLDGRQDLVKPEAYRDYVARALADLEGSDAEMFFREKLRGVTESTAPFGLSDIHGGISRVESSETLDPAVRKLVCIQARRLGVSAARLFHAAWGLVVAHTSGRDDIVYGTVVLTKPLRHTQRRRMLGMAVNTLPLRLCLRGLTAEQLVEHTHQEISALLKHDQAPVTLTQKCSGVRGSVSLFSALLNYRHDTPEFRGGRSDSNTSRVLGTGEAWTNYPITMLIDELGDDFLLTAQTDPSIDPHRIIAYLQVAMRSLAEALEAAPATLAMSLSILPQSERRQVIESFNETTVTPSNETLIHELFESQAARTPDAIAIVCEGLEVTYSELNRRANQLARYLRTKGVEPGQLVSICVERSLELVTGLIGILKAGGGYVPLDPAYPLERLTYMLADAMPSVLLIEEKLREKFPETAVEIISLDGAWNIISEKPDSNLSAEEVNLRSYQLAYVIYTSGSTGQPKGVMVEHRSVTRLFSATAKWFGFNEQDVWTLCHSYAFDFSVWELWGALLHGGRVVIVPYHTTRSPQDLYALICKERVTVLSQTPSAFAQLIEAQAQGSGEHLLRVIIFGGEALELHTLRSWVKRNGIKNPTLVNMYGITETTVHVTYRPLSERDIAFERSNLIGTPIEDMQVYLLNQYMQPVPVGVTGEIFVGGSGIARGYLNRPALTAQRFLADPFGADPQSRLYRSGDLGLWRSDGTIEYLGRRDDQVKIRGFRIELGEIEACLARHELVKEAVVITREDTPGDKRLVAYLVPHGAPYEEASPTADTFRSHIAATLPEFMVPNAFVVMQRFPLTPNGKLDRGALPMPDISAYSSRSYEPPQGRIEEALAELWREVLQLDRVGREDDFFLLGGHSLLGMKLITRISQKLGTQPAVGTVFRYRTIRRMAELVRKMLLSDDLSTSDKADIDEEVI